MTSVTGIGKCHLCRLSDRIVTFCAVCDHYFCEECRRKYWQRGISAVKQMIGGKRKGCCGIMEW